MLRQWAARFTATYLLAFVVVSVTGASCVDWSSRTVEGLDASWEEAVVAVGERDVIKVGALPAGASAAVLPGATLLSADAGVRAVFHEAAHHVQMEQSGIVEYLVTYGVDWATGMYRGCGPYDAYRSVGYEIQARDFARSYAARFITLLGEDVDGNAFARALVDLEAAGTLEALVAQRDRRPLAAAVLAEAGFDVRAMTIADDTARREYLTADRTERSAASKVLCGVDDC